LRADFDGSSGSKDEGDHIAFASGHMAIDRVVAKVQDAIFIPFDRDRVVRPVANFGRRGEPVDALGLFAPKTSGSDMLAAYRRSYSAALQCVSCVALSGAGNQS
jgi:hypothetical protein